MNKISLIAGAAAVLGMTLPVAALAQTAQTYEYVNTNGVIEQVSATSADQALLLAPDIAPHSGVLLVSVYTTVPAVNSPVVTTTTTTTDGGTSMNTTSTNMTGTNSGNASTDEMNDLPPGAILPGTNVATSTSINYTATTT